MNAEVMKLLEGFERLPPVGSEENQRLANELRLELPADYLELFSFMNGGEGYIGESYCRLFRLDELGPLNEAFAVREFAPELFLFGSDGGGNAFAFDKAGSRMAVVGVPFIPLDMEWARPLGASMSEFFSRLSEGAKKNRAQVDKALIGKELHEIHPVAFGGDPGDPKNKVALPVREYAELVVFWNRAWLRRKKPQAAGR